MVLIETPEGIFEKIDFKTLDVNQENGTLTITLHNPKDTQKAEREIMHRFNLTHTPGVSPEPVVHPPRDWAEVARITDEEGNSKTIRELKREEKLGKVIEEVNQKAGSNLFSLY